MFVRLMTVVVSTAAVLSMAAGTAGAMSHGQPATVGSAPWFATIVYRDGVTLGGTTITGERADRIHCGGALVDPHTVLTAAHCVSDLVENIGTPPRAESPNDIRVIIGDRPVSDQTSPELSVRRIDLHPDFRLVPNPRNPSDVESAAAGNDLALLTLDRPVANGRTIAVSTSPGLPGTPVALYGHGTVPDFGTSDRLLRGPLSVISPAQCARQAFVDPVREGMICAQSPQGRPSVQAGFGDSGGPLVTTGPGGRVGLVGIFSFGTETIHTVFTPGFNAATDVRVGAVRWPALRAHLHL